MLQNRSLQGDDTDRQSRRREGRHGRKRPRGQCDFIESYALAVARCENRYGAFMPRCARIMNSLVETRPGRSCDKKEERGD